MARDVEQQAELPAHSGAAARQRAVLELEQMPGDVPAVVLAAEAAAAAAVEDEETMATLGPDAWPVIEPGPFAELIDQPRHLHPLLRHQRDIAGIGRSWVDEILWEARLHPKRTVRSLTRDEQIALYAAMQHVLAWAVDEVESGTPPELGVKVRGHMKVRGRYGTGCPRCGGKIRRTRKGDDETDYCPACQPPPPGQLL